MTSSVVHPTWVNYLFRIHCICIKRSYLLWCHVCIIWDRAHLTNIVWCYPLTVGSETQFNCIFLIFWWDTLYHVISAIIRCKFGTIALVSYLLLLLSLLLIIWIIILHTKTGTIGRVVHWLHFVVDRGTFCLEKVGGVAPFSLVFIHQLYTRETWIWFHWTEIVTIIIIHNQIIWRASSLLNHSCSCYILIESRIVLIILHWNISSHIYGLIDFLIMHHSSILNSWIAHQPIRSHHLPWHCNPHIAISFLRVSVTSTALSTRCASIIIMVALVRAIWNNCDVVQILLIGASWDLCAIRGACLRAASNSILPLAMVSIPIVFGTCHFSIPSESTSLALIALRSLGLLYHVDLAHLWVHIILQRWDKARLFFATDCHKLVLLLSRVE